MNRAQTSPFKSFLEFLSPSPCCRACVLIPFATWLHDLWLSHASHLCLCLWLLWLTAFPHFAPAAFACDFATFPLSHTLHFCDFSVLLAASALVPFPYPILTLSWDAGGHLRLVLSSAVISWQHPSASQATDEQLPPFQYPPPCLLCLHHTTKHPHCRHWTSAWHTRYISYTTTMYCNNSRIDIIH